MDPERRPFIAGNWKMNVGGPEAAALALAVAGAVRAHDAVDVLVAPPFTALAAVRAALDDAGSRVALGAQNMSEEADGAFTGEISSSMLRSAGVTWVLLGHSERRQKSGETDDLVAKKTARAMTTGPRPIVCVGETLAERESGRTFEVVGGQLDGSLALADAGKAAELVVAYEPVWAIGTGRTATPEIAQEAHAFIRGSLSKRFGSDAQSIRILYGGSVKPDNAEALLAQDDIDGGLVGGASLDPASFSAIIRFRDSGSEG